MIPLVSDVLFDGDFEFKDGVVGEKYFVVLADVEDDQGKVYVARVTSKPKSERVEACHFDYFGPLYYLT